MKRLFVILVVGVFENHGFAQNPILPVTDGMTDPHIHVYDGKAYMVVGHDSSINNKWFEMNYWAMYASSNLVN